MPYVDGLAVPYAKGGSGTGAGNFANAALNVMSRNAASLFGAGDLDELALYTTTLSAATIAAHYTAGTGASPNAKPTAAFTATPSPATTGQQVSLDASGSSDSDGTIAKYEWDLDGNGTYETDTGTTPTTTQTYATAGDVTVGLRVTDNDGATDTTTRTLTVQPVANQAPTAAFTLSPNPATTGQQVSLDASGSSDSDGTIAKYEWDLDGNGTYETDTGTTPTTTQTYATAGDVTVGLRVTDNDGATDTTSHALTVQAPPPPSSAYAQVVLTTPGAKDYWRLGEVLGHQPHRPARHDAADRPGGVTLGVPGALSGDSDTAARFDGVNDAARATVNLSATNKLTVEFWLKWNAYANDDRLAMELTPNFNQNAGGFVIDP
ncbi:MAG: PKD domain-containing protein [Solirubrobacterales bacterium]